MYWVVGEVGIGNVALDAVNGEEAVEGATSSIFDDITEAFYAGGFSY
jgi:hypothetical protein